MSCGLVGIHDGTLSGLHSLTRTTSTAPAPARGPRHRSRPPPSVDRSSARRSSPAGSTASARTSAVFAASFTASRSASRRAASEPSTPTRTRTARTPATSWRKIRRGWTGVGAPRPGPPVASVCHAGPASPAQGGGDEEAAPRREVSRRIRVHPSRLRGRPRHRGRSRRRCRRVRCRRPRGHCCRRRHRGWPGPPRSPADAAHPCRRSRRASPGRPSRTGTAGRPCRRRHRGWPGRPRSPADAAHPCRRSRRASPGRPRSGPADPLVVAEVVVGAGRRRHRGGDLDGEALGERGVAEQPDGRGDGGDAGPDEDDDGAPHGVLLSVEEVWHRADGPTRAQPGTRALAVVASHRPSPCGAGRRVPAGGETVRRSRGQPPLGDGRRPPAADVAAGRRAALSRRTAPGAQGYAARAAGRDARRPVRRGRRAASGS